MIHIEEMKLLLLLGNRLVMLSRLATVGGSYPRKHIRGNNKNGCMCVCVCVCVCSSITLELLERFQPNLVHI
jgi:hypothetical protein